MCYARLNHELLGKPYTILPGYKFYGYNLLPPVLDKLVCWAFSILKKAVVKDSCSLQFGGIL